MAIVREACPLELSVNTQGRIRYPGCTMKGHYPGATTIGQPITFRAAINGSTWTPQGFQSRAINIRMSANDNPRPLSGIAGQCHQAGTLRILHRRGVILLLGKLCCHTFAAVSHAEKQAWSMVNDFSWASHAFCSLFVQRNPHGRRKTTVLHFILARARSAHTRNPRGMEISKGNSESWKSMGVYPFLGLSARIGTSPPLFHHFSDEWGDSRACGLPRKSSRFNAFRAAFTFYIKPACEGNLSRTVDRVSLFGGSFNVSSHSISKEEGHKRKLVAPKDLCDYPNQTLTTHPKLWSRLTRRPWSQWPVFPCCMDR